MDVALKPEVSTSSRQLFDFFKENYEKDSHFAIDKNLFQSYVQSRNLVITKDNVIRETELIMINEIEFTNSTEKKEVMPFYIKLTDFTNRLRNYLKVNILKEAPSPAFKLMASAPLKAYEYVGHNNLKIGEPNDYALLFGDK